MTGPTDRPTDRSSDTSAARTKQPEGGQRPWEVYFILLALAIALVWVIATNDPTEEPAVAEPPASPEESYARTEACRTWLVNQPAVADDFLTTLREQPADTDSGTDTDSDTGTDTDTGTGTGGEKRSGAGIDLARGETVPPRPSKQIVDALDQSADSLRDAALVRHLSPADFDAFLAATQTTEALHQAVTDLRPNPSTEEAMDLVVALSADHDDTLELLTIVCEDT